MKEKNQENQVIDHQTKLNWQNLQANYSAMLYILSEQQALIAELLEHLLTVGVLNAQGLTRVTGVYGNPDKLNPAYDDLYKRFAVYFFRIKEVLENPDAYQPEIPFPEEPENHG